MLLAPPTSESSHAVRVAAAAMLGFVLQWTALQPAAAQVQRVTITPQIEKLRPLTPEQARLLEGIRAWSDAHVRSLPDYICIQTTKRSAQPAALDAWPIRDEVRELLTFSDRRETYEVQSVNGKPVHMSRSALQGNISSGEFGTLLDRLFIPESAAQFGYERRTKLRGVEVDVFAYRVSNEHGYTLYSGYQKYESAWQGLVYANHADGTILRISMECTGIPVNFPVHHIYMTLDYGPVKIGDREYMLPSQFDLTQESSGGITSNHAHFDSYRKFETEASFTPTAQ